MAKLHTLTKIRLAHKSKDGAEGILYVHQWPTGFQELIFTSEKMAEQFLDKLNGEEAEMPATPQTVLPFKSAEAR